MINDHSFSRMAAIAAIASLRSQPGIFMAMLATVHFNVAGMTNPLILLHAGTRLRHVALEHGSRHLRLLPTDRAPNPPSSGLPSHQSPN